MLTGYALYSGERVLSAADAQVQLSFVDGSSITLAPKTDFLIERFEYRTPVIASPPLVIGKQPTTRSNIAIFQLFAGGFRAVSGLIGKQGGGEYAVRTPVASIGIRGTSYLAFLCDALCAAETLIKAAMNGNGNPVRGLISMVEDGMITVRSLTGLEAAVAKDNALLTSEEGKQYALEKIPSALLKLLSGLDSTAMPNVLTQATEIADKTATVAKTTASGAGTTATAGGGVAAQTAVASSISPLAGTSLITFPVVGGAALAVTAVAIVANGSDGEGGGAAAPTATAPAAR